MERGDVPRPAEVPLVCNLHGRVLAADECLDAAYWRRQAREPVRFADCVQSLATMGCTALLELGPHPVLAAMAEACWPGEAPPRRVASDRWSAPSTRRRAAPASPRPAPTWSARAG